MLDTWLAQIMEMNPSGFDMVDVALRLGAAVVVGMLIGLNRDIADKPIGMRTLGLVSLGAAVVAISTIHFADLANSPDALSRVVQGVIQGIMTGVLAIAVFGIPAESIGGDQ